MALISKKIRESARGQECQVRIPGICNHNNETVVFAHIGNYSGIGQKVNDIHGVYACSACHDEIDRRTRKLELSFVQNCAYEGMVRTQNLLLQSELIKVA